MSTLTAAEKTAMAGEHRVADDKTIFGFWAYIMTDGVLFASLFATFAVLHNCTFGGPGSAKNGGN